MYSAVLSAIVSSLLLINIAMEKITTQVIFESTKSTSGCELYEDIDSVFVRGDGLFNYKTGEEILNTAAGQVEFSSDYSYIAVGNDGLYRTHNAEKLFSIGEGLLRFEYNDQYLIVDRDGVYNIDKKEKIIEITSDLEVDASSHSSLIAISDPILGTKIYDINDIGTSIEIPDYGRPQFIGKDDYLVVDTFPSGFTVYDVSTGLEVWEDNEDVTVKYDRNREFIVIEKRNDVTDLYDVRTGELLVSTNVDGYPRFSLYGRYYGVSGWGIYDLEQREMLFEVGGDGLLNFSHDGRFVSIPGDGIYSLLSRHKIIEARGISTIWFDPTSKYAVEEGAGVYDLYEREMIFSIGSIYMSHFSRDGKLLSVAQEGVYLVDSGEKVTEVYVTTFSSDGLIWLVSDLDSCSVIEYKID